jgi:hypothetical protein
MKMVSLILSLVLCTLLLVSCTSKPEETLRVTKEFNPEWLSDERYPDGGLIVDRGEGSHGIIEVEIPHPGASATGPIVLSDSSVTQMNIEVVTADGETKHFGDEAISTASYRISFSHTWDDGITVEYVIENNILPD